MKSISILKRNLMRTAMTLALIVTCVSAWAQGLTINTADEWNIFATNVSNGTSYSGQTVTLAANISVSTMAGLNQTNSFKGTFDGGGHTLTFNYTATEQYAAPFRYIDGATIKNLHVDGTIQTSAKYAAGIAAQEYGTTSIKNCRSSIVVTSSVDGDGTHSGFVAVNNNSTLTIEGCIFDGKLLTTNGTNNCGGFVGWKGGTVNITNSIYNPADIASSETEVLPGDGQYMSKTFARMDVNTITNCYYTRILGLAQGKQRHSITAGNNVTIENIALTGNPTTYNVSGITAYSNGLDYGGTLYYGNGDNVSLTLSTSLTESYFYYVTGGTLSSNGDSYTLTMPDADVTISAASNSNITAISSVTDWVVFCAAVNDGHDYSNETVTLTGNVTVGSENNPVSSSYYMAGTSGHRFKGTFNGQGNTLTFFYSATTDDAAPFAYLEGATIENLHVNGTIQTSAKYAAGIAAHTYGATITNCQSSIVVKSNISGDGTHGGFIAVNESGTLDITGCLFNGKLLTTNGTDHCGGFVGWRNGTLNITNSIYNPAEIVTGEETEVGANDTYTFGRRSVDNITNCYYTRTLGTAQGKQRHSITAGENVTIDAIALTGTSTPYNVSGITAYSGGGLDQNGTLYYGSGDHVSLTLSTTLPEPYAYSVTGGTLSGSGNSYMLNMPDADVTISIQPSGPYITLDPTSATVLTGFTQTLTASYGNVSGTPTITYSSSNTNVATVSGSGTTATVTAVAPGTATITATMTYEGNTYTGECPITVEDPSYCMPAPTSVDGKGITSLTFGSGDYQVNNSNSSGLPASSPYYGDYTSMVGGYEPGETATVTITYSTGSYTVYSYGTLIWVDWNKNYTFEDSEIVYTGTSAQGSNGTPQVLTATFTIPAAQAADDYRMRIAGADNYFDDYISGSSSANHDPCFTSSYAVCHDYTLRVVAAGAYTITCATTTGGTISADKTYADESDVITITATPETDYLLTALTYTPEGGSAQNITFSGNTGTFTMPAANVTVNATFTQPNCPKPTNLTVSNLAAHSANVGWNGESESYTVQYRTATVTGTTVEQTYSYGFEDENLSGWTTHALVDNTPGTN